jgi:hypothetical protein
MGPVEGARTPRRDEKARETIEAALAAAREAAMRKQNALGMPTGDVKKDLSNLVSIARESIVAAVDVVGDRIVNRVEEKLPTLVDILRKTWEAQKERRRKEHE